MIVYHGLPWFIMVCHGLSMLIIIFPTKKSIWKSNRPIYDGNTSLKMIHSSYLYVISHAREGGIHVMLFADYSWRIWFATLAKGS